MGRTFKQKGALMSKGLAKEANKTTRMNAALQDRADELQGLLGASIEQTFVFKYNAGQMFVDIKAHPDIYGLNGVTLLRDYLKMSARDVTQTIKLVNKYELSEILDIARRHTQLPKAQGRINWAHMDNLLRGCLTPADVKHLVDLTINRGWSAPELSKYIKENYSGENSRGGRPLQGGSKMAIVSRFTKDFSEFQTHYMKLWTDLSNPAKTALTHQLEDLTEDALTELLKLVEFLDSVEASVLEMRETIAETGMVKLWTDYLREHVNSEGNTPEEQAKKDAEENSVELALGDDPESDDDDDEEDSEEETEDFDDGVDDLVARAMAD